MIEPLPIGPNEASRVEEKLDETIREVNRLTALLAHLTLPIRGEIGAEGAVRWAAGPHPMQGEVQRSENDLTWPKDKAKGGLRMGPGITRRPKEKP